MATCTLSIVSLGVIPLGVGAYKLYNRFKPISITIPTSHFLDVHQRIMASSKRVFQFASTDVQVGALERSSFSQVVQEKVLDRFYRQKHPKKEEVLVPAIAEMKLTDRQQNTVIQTHGIDVIKYGELTNKQKIILNNHFGRAHNQITKQHITDEEIDEYFFTVHGQSEFLLHDPRGGHGCDHAVRASLLVPVFAYLYQKYHPEVKLSEKEMLAAEFVASLHDAKRSAEGTDVFDEMSAACAVDTLKELGITDKKMLQNAREAVRNKDSDPLDATHPKPILSRLVQNADSADFPRIFLKGEEQSGHSFENSRKFLDIYKELHALSKGNTKAVLKDGLTFGDFLEELDALLKEKNKLAFRTHHKEFREPASELGKNYYEEVLNTVTFTEYPHLHYVLSVVNVGSKCQVSAQLHEYREIARIHYKEMSVEALLQKIKEVEAFDPSLLRDETLSELQKCKSKLQSMQKKAFLPAVDVATCSHDVLKATRDALLKLDTSALREIERTELAAMYHDIIVRYTNEGALDALTSVLHESALKVHLHSDAMLYRLIQKPEELAGSDPLYLHADTTTVRKRSVRFQQKTFDTGEKRLELSFQLQSSGSNKYHALLQELRKKPPEGVKISDATMKFEKKNADNTFSQTVSLPASSAHLIEKDGITLEIGSDLRCYNTYNLVRIRAPVPCDPAKIQAFLAELGLCHVLCTSRDQDIKKEFFNKVIQFRFPDKVFSRDPKVSPEEVYASLNTAERALVDGDMKSKKLSEVSNNHFEFVQPKLIDEARKAGVRGFLTNIIAPDAATCADILIRIVQGDLLSTTERYLSGIIGFGTCPAYNMEHGSANQAFTRLITTGFVEKKYDLGELSYSSSKIFIVYGVETSERMPYSYPFDCGGMRNPTFKNPEFKIHGFKTLTNAKGHDLLQYRKTLTDLAAHIDRTDDPISQGNEVMFDQALGSKYIQCIMVPANMRKQVIQLFKAHGIEEINGKSVDECIVEVGRIDAKMLMQN